MERLKRPLLQRWPGLAERLGPLGLAALPTPVVHLPDLGRAVGHPGLYLKCDHLTSELYGGNKVRKLEFLLGDALRRGAQTLVTMGGTGSNHLLATALHGRAHGLRTVGVVFPQPENEKVRRNLAANRGAGTELVRVPSKYLLPLGVAEALARVRLQEHEPAVLIPGGGSSPLGALGFVNAGLELAGQVRAGMLPEPEAVVLPYGTGGTACGLALGLQLAGLRSRVVAVRVIDRLLANRRRMLALLDKVIDFLVRHADPVAVPARPGENLELVHGWIGPGYGAPTPEAEHAVALFAEHEDIELELTYTGKAAAAMLELAGEVRGPLLFWNTYNAADISGWVV